MLTTTYPASSCLFLTLLHTFSRKLTFRKEEPERRRSVSLQSIPQGLPQTQHHPDTGPLAVIVGIGLLAEKIIQLGTCLRDVYEAVSSFEDVIEFLFREIQDLDSVNRAFAEDRGRRSYP